MSINNQDSQTNIEKEVEQGLDFTLSQLNKDQLL